MLIINKFFDCLKKSCLKGEYILIDGEYTKIEKINRVEIRNIVKYHVNLLRDASIDITIRRESL